MKGSNPEFPLMAMKGSNPEFPLMAMKGSNLEFPLQVGILDLNLHFHQREGGNYN